MITRPLIDASTGLVIPRRRIRQVKGKELRVKGKELRVKGKELRVKG